MLHPNFDLVKKHKFSPGPLNSYFKAFVPFAYDVYRDKVRPALPDGWSIYADYQQSDDDGNYFGSCYIQKNFVGELSAVIFAHRGTVVKFIDNIVGDIAVAIGNVPIQYAAAYNFVSQTIAKLKQEYQQFSEGYVSHVGHSLGAILAELCAAAFQSVSFSFESPGSRPIFKTMIQAGTLPQSALTYAQGACQITLSHVNVINTCNEQISDLLFPCITFPYTFDVFGGPTLNVPILFFDNSYYLFGYSLDQHSIENIYNYFMTETGSRVSKVVEANTWPVGLQNGYDFYRSELRNGLYWGQYTQFFWNANIWIRTAYLGSFSQFQQAFIRTNLINTIDQYARTYQKPLALQEVVAEEETTCFSGCLQFFKAKVRSFCLSQPQSNRYQPIPDAEPHELTRGDMRLS